MYGILPCGRGDDSVQGETVTGLDVRAERVRAGLYQVQVGGLLGVSQPEVSRIELGYRTQERMREVLATIAKYVARKSGHG